MMRELDAYLANGDDSFALRREDKHRWHFVSQTWREAIWSHDLTLSGDFPASDLAILVVTGGDVNNLDEEEAGWLSALSGLPVATLYHIPNQPLFGDLWEDDLIAFTFMQFLETGEGDWPLLLPMAKAVVRAMDALEVVTEGKLRRFLVTGLSKRGWTTWLAGATGDPRIVGIAPMVIDHLNMPVQMKHQIATWGDYSEQIRSYTELELPKELDSPEGRQLNAIVDPYAYLNRYRVPILIVNGANDRYWQVDALKNYWPDLPDPKWASIIPNVEHVLGDKLAKQHVLAGFARCLAAGIPIETPKCVWSHTTDASTADLQPPLTFTSSRLWVAYSPTYDFRDSKWRIAGEGLRRLAVARPKECYTALLPEMRCRVEGVEFGLTTPVEVVGPSLR